MPASTGGVNVFPSLESIAQLFRARINDDGAGQNNAPGEGQVATDAAPFMIPFMNSAMEELFSDLRIVGDQELVFDNYIVEGLPVVNGPYGVGQVAPETQVYLDIEQFFDGTVMWPAFKLPIYTRNVLMVWERKTGSANNFYPMENVSYLPPLAQTERMGCWEYRQNAIWMPGSIVQRDLRIRGTIGFNDYIGDSTSIDFSTTYFPIVDSKRAIVDNMLLQYAMRNAPEMITPMQNKYDADVLKLRQESVLRKQAVEVSRGEFAPTQTAWGLASEL